MKMEFSAGTVVYQKVASSSTSFKFALIKDQSDQWTFPKGHIEKNEKPEVAAARETKEEIGVTDLKIIVLLEKTDYWFKFEDDLIHKFVYFYLAEAPNDGELKAQLCEIQDARWFTPDLAMKTIGYKKQNQVILLKAYELLGITCDISPEEI